MKHPAMTRIAMVLADLDKLADEKLLASRMPQVNPAESCGDVCTCNNTCGCDDEH